MGEHYGQLSLEERVEIYRLHAGGKSLRSIGFALGRSASTISRELTRNGLATKVWPGGYDPVRADQLAWRRRRWDKRFKLARQPDLRELVRDRLAMGVSPEQIAGRLAREHGRIVISHESIYRYVYHRSANKDYWHRLLPRAKSRRGRLGTQGGNLARLIKHRKPLAERPREANDRCQGGHWEADFMLFSQPGQCALVLLERTSRIAQLLRTPDRKAPTTVRHLGNMLAGVPPQLRRTIAFDNGPEFALHYQLANQIGIATYFCDAHAPWQKGAIENAIGRIRRMLPRKTNLENLDTTSFRTIIERYNNTPRKCLDFQTPREAYQQLQLTVALQS
jgi:IS30 family transposase